MCNCHISLTNGESHGESSHAKNQIFQIISLIITSSTVSQYKNPKNIWLFLDLFFQKSQIYISTFLDVLLQKISNIFIYFLDYLSKANYQFDQQNWEEWVERRNGFHISARSQSTLKSKTYFNISWFPSLNFLLGFAWLSFRCS